MSLTTQPTKHVGATTALDWYPCAGFSEFREQQKVEEALEQRAQQLELKMEAAANLQEEV